MPDAKLATLGDSSVRAIILCYFASILTDFPVSYATSQVPWTQEIDILLFGDSIFESTLGTSIGHQVRRAEGIPAVWQNYRKDSNKRVMAITGKPHTP